MSQDDPLIEKRQYIAQILDTLTIPYQVYQHPPLMDCHQADKLGLVRNGTRTKNLFLQDNPGKRHFILILRHDQEVDLKRLAKQQHTQRLGFASPRRLAKYLHATPGAVSPLELIFDIHHQVELWVDHKLWASSQALQCHPGDNRYTWVIAREDLKRLFNWTGHSLTLLSTS